jgi:hypothetical protein
VARTPTAEYLVLDIETIPDVERWKRPDVMPATGAPPAPPFPPAWAHRIIDRAQRFGSLASSP